LFLLALRLLTAGLLLALKAGAGWPFAFAIIFATSTVFEFGISKLESGKEGSMRVFVSYGGVADQVTALRLQALGNVHGVTIYVPPADTRHGFAAVLDAKTHQELRQANVVLALIGTGWTEACSRELTTGIHLGKRIIPMTTPSFVPEVQGYFGSNIIVIDPANADVVERGIVQYVNSMDAEQSFKRPLLALGTLALGLLIFPPVAAD
jgi:hypothetical protein